MNRPGTRTIHDPPAEKGAPRDSTARRRPFRLAPRPARVGRGDSDREGAPPLLTLASGLGHYRRPPGATTRRDLSDQGDHLVSPAPFEDRMLDSVPPEEARRGVLNALWTF